MKTGIYKITNQINNKSYIGQSVNIERRWADEKYRAFSEGSNEYEYPRSKAFRKYGVENFKFEILELCSHSQLNEREIYYINYYKTIVPYGYNVTSGGSNAAGVKLDIYRVEEISDLLKNTTLTNIEIGKMFNVSENMVSGINTGYYWNRENVDYPIRKKKKETEKIIESKTKLDIPDKEEMVDIIYNNNFTYAANYYQVSTTTIRRWLDRYNVPRTVEEFRKWYQNEKNIKIEDNITKQSGPLRTIVYDKNGCFISIENSRADCCLKYNIDSGHASACVQGKRKTANGYILRNYKENFPQSINTSSSWKEDFWI